MEGNDGGVRSQRGCAARPATPGGEGGSQGWRRGARQAPLAPPPGEVCSSAERGAAWVPGGPRRPPRRSSGRARGRPPPKGDDPPFAHPPGPEPGSPWSMEPKRNSSWSLSAASSLRDSPSSSAGRGKSGSPSDWSVSGCASSLDSVPPARGRGGGRSHTGASSPAPHAADAAQLSEAWLAGRPVPRHRASAPHRL